MIPVILTVVATIVFVQSPEYLRAFRTAVTLFFGVLISIFLVVFLSLATNHVTTDIPVAVAAESATHVVFEADSGLVSVSRGEIKYEDNCEGYRYVVSTVPRWVMGVSLPWESYYVSCEALTNTP